MHRANGYNATMTNRPSILLSSTHILDAMSDPIFVKDSARRWIYVNKAMCNFLNKTEAELLGKDESAFMPHEICQTYWKEDDWVLETGRECHKEEDVHCDHTPATRILTKKTRLEFEGEFFIFGIIRDVTSLSHKGRLSQLGEIAANLSHELLTPLTIMDFQLKNYTEKINEGSMSSDEVKGFISGMEKSKDRLLNIIKSVRAFAADQQALPMELVSLQSIVDEAVEMATPRLEMHKVKLTIDKIPTINVKCRGTQLSQILINLLHNAADAVSTLEDPWIKMTFEVNNSWCEICVIDKGNGIPPDIASRLMTPFFTTKPSCQGTGLGLSLASKFAHDHGGHLFYDDKERHTCFRLQLPRTN